MPNDIFELGDVTVEPGHRRIVRLPLPELYSHSPISMPVQVLHGKHPGPALFVSAAVHGDEINGLEIIRRLVARIDPQRLRGTLVAVPVVNVYGFVNRSRYLPDRRDLNRSFPGSTGGSMASRLANTFVESIAARCTHGIDLHTGAIGRENLPQIRGQILDDQVIEDMARAFGAPIMLNARVIEGTLREAMARKGIPLLLYEAGEALRFDEVSIRGGVDGTIRVMRQLGMLRAGRARKNPAVSVLARGSTWLRAPQSGILRSVVPLGGTVEAGQTIGWIADPFGEQEAAVVADVDGVIIGRTTVPLVHAGEALIHVATFKESDSAAESVEQYQEELDPQREQDHHQEPPLV